ncbi:hypothetical protein D1816_10550 [Aquimarina sp. AD10]|uniref:UBP-type domain-containing protein n=1 Tax=Aquimarina aggregata TaxID=1642818 RepID=A0A162FCM0_9FLAO|nr:MULTISPECIES: hypothetical protein [Aquimarina]AXT60768.1 hypothetical protein D1816_10550 [Aquimarina sp. AD10]KZS41256.1 hypothetical protein AWE51_22905 [Aquimarina aggregata]RKM98532.1 hypothetical protein D7033_12745 [Aquimarina sp. AD10]
MAFKPKICDHLQHFDKNTIKKNDSYQCSECIKTGDSWVHLRTCQECGITLCCDSSPNKHASNHYASHNAHSVIISAEPNEKWAWCYEHKSFLQY